MAGDPLRAVFNSARRGVEEAAGPGARRVPAWNRDRRIVACPPGPAASAFHPELTGDPRVHKLFVDMVKESAMSHSKRATTKYKKAVIDARRGSSSPSRSTTRWRGRRATACATGYAVDVVQKAKKICAERQHRPGDLRGVVEAAAPAYDGQLRGHAPGG